MQLRSWSLTALASGLCLAMTAAVGAQVPDNTNSDGSAAKTKTHPKKAGR